MKKKINILIASPAYNGLYQLDFVNSLLDFHRKKIPFSLLGIANESLIPRGRDTCISYFHTLMDFTNLLFMDADIGLSAEGLIQLLSHDKDVIGAPVRLKGFDAEGNYVYNVGKKLGEENGLIETDRIGTAVFCLSRKAVNSLVKNAKDNKDIYYSNPHSRGDAQNITMYNIFKIGVINKEYDSEDYYVCRILRELGYKIYVDTTIETRHNGIFAF